MPADYETFELGDFQLQSGAVLPGAWIAYKTYGKAGSPAILYPSWYSGSIADNEWLVGEDKALNPAEYFIVITALFGNGQSISPSNSDLVPFPDVTFYDNVRAQHQLLTQKLDVHHLRMVTGWSMGAGQSFQWATQYPNFLDICVPFCGSAKTSLHNQVFLEGVKSALLAAKGLSSAGSTFGRVEDKSNQEGKTRRVEVFLQADSNRTLEKPHLDRRGKDRRPESVWTRLRRLGVQPDVLPTKTARKGVRGEIPGRLYADVLGDLGLQ
jgi:homoserine O-acetyltransferase